MFYIKEKNYLIRKNYYKETHVFDLNTYKHVPSLEKCFDGLTYEAFCMIYQIDGKKNIRWIRRTVSDNRFYKLHS